MMENSISNIRLSLLLPTRGRPDRLRQVLNSIEATAAQKYNLIVNIYVDDDDTDTLSFSKAAALSQEYHYFIQWHVACRVSSMGAMVNELVRVSPEADIYMQVADDYMFATEAWDDVLRRVALQYSDGIWLAYPHDPTSPGDVTFIIMGARWIELTGRFLTPHFAFWFDDLWLDQVAQMVQRKVSVPVGMHPFDARGKTQRIFNLWFWRQFFANTLDERIAEADKLRIAVYGRNTSAYKESYARGVALAGEFKMKEEAISRDYMAALELTYKDGEATDNTSFKLLYIRKEVEAIIHLCDKLLTNASGESAGVQGIIRNIGDTSLPIRYVKSLMPNIARSGAKSVDVGLVIMRIKEELLTMKRWLEEDALPEGFRLNATEYSIMILVKSWFIILMSTPVIRQVRLWLKKLKISPKSS